MRYNACILRMDSGRPAHSALHVRFHRFIPTGTTIPANTAASQPRAPRRHRNILVITAHRRPLPQSRTGGFICAVPCGIVLRMHARLVSLRVSAGWFLRLHAAVSLSYSLHCVFRGGRETSSSEALFLSLPAPSLSSSTAGLPRCFAHGLIFLCSSLRGSSAYARAACFFAGLRGAVSAPARGSFSFLFSALCFPGRERNLFFRGVVSLPPPPPPSLPALQACHGALHTGLFFFAVPCGAVLRVHAAVFLSYSLHCVFRGGRETSSSEALFLSLPLPLFQHCRLAAVLCTRAYFSLQFTAGQFCVCTRGLFLCGSPRGGSCACTCSAAVCKLRGSGQFTNGYQISHLKNNNLPMAKFYFAIYQT